jgi:hypothetical protein
MVGAPETFRFGTVREESAGSERLCVISARGCEKHTGFVRLKLVVEACPLQMWGRPAFYRESCQVSSCSLRWAVQRAVLSGDAIRQLHCSALPLDKHGIRQVSCVFVCRDSKNGRRWTG